MEGSPAMAPAAVDAAPDTQLGADQALEQTQPDLTQPETPAAPEGDVQAQIRAAEERAKAAEAQLQEMQQGQPQDLLSALDQEEDYGLTPEQLAAYQAGQDPAQAQEGEQDLSELKDFVKQISEEAITPLREERDTERIEAWERDHPDVKYGTPIFKELLGTMENLKAEFGDQAVKSPALLDMAYTAAKAKLADDGAVPAEQAAQHGASLETGAGQTQVGEDSEADEYRKKVFGIGTRSAFE